MDQSDVHNFIIMHERFVKSKRGNSVNKSNTTITLPGIHKYTNPSSFKKKKQQSSYLDTISYLSNNIDYEKQDKQFVIKQQSTLKSILKKINNDTMELINNIKPKRSPRMPSKQRQYETMDMELQNSKKMLHNLNYQVEQLKQKYKMIVDERQDIQINKKISVVKKEIQELKQSNVGQQSFIFREGKQIEQHLQFGQDSRLMNTQTDHHLVMNRLDKLKTDNNRVQEQNNKLTTKLKDLEPFIRQLQEECQLIKARNAELAIQKNRVVQSNQKKYQIQNLKKRIDFIKKSGQVRYYKLLKDLEAENGCVTLIQNKTTQLESRTQLAKNQIEKLQQLLLEAKQKKKQKNQYVMEYLSSSRKLKGPQDSRILPEFNSEVDEMRTEWIDNKDREDRQIKSENVILHDPRISEDKEERRSEEKDTPFDETTKQIKQEDQKTPQVSAEEPNPLYHPVQVPQSIKLLKAEESPIKVMESEKI